jgi:Phage integrase, N-terminal SAM-like domain
VLTTDGTYKRVHMYGKTREEVHGKLVEAQQRSNRGVPVADKPWKLGEYLEYWLEHIVRPSVRWNTYKKYEQTVRLYLKPGLGKQRLDRLRVARVQAFLNEQIKAGHSVANVHIMRMVLGAALTRAMREELITVNAARLATLPPAPGARSSPGRRTRLGRSWPLRVPNGCTRRSSCCSSTGCGAVKSSACPGMTSTWTRRSCGSSGRCSV